MDLGLSGKRALVGGGGSGIGAGIATALAAEGARVVLAGRTAERLRGARPQPSVAAWVVADLSTPDGPADRGRVGRRPARWPGPARRQLRRPARGHVRAARRGRVARAIEGTLQSTSGSSAPRCRTCARGVDPAIVVNLSSSVREPIPGLTTSNVLRPGLVGLIKSLTAEIAPIRINGVAPGRFATDRVRQLDASSRPGRRPDDRRGAAPDGGEDPAGPLRQPPTRSVAWPPSCCHLRPRTSPAPSCRSTAAWSGRCHERGRTGIRRAADPA